ncbi:hypothetical protein POUND7_010412 [Theobroma cacao]
MKQTSSASWNAILSGLAMHGLAEKALELFSRMTGGGFKLDDITFVGRAVLFDEAEALINMEMKPDGAIWGSLLGTCTVHKRVELVDTLLEKAGFVTDTSEVLQDMVEDWKEEALSHHSEKLAIAFGLISTKPGTTIRIVKNLRVCGNCHSATKLISKIFNKEIIARDRNRFHHFKDGFCSCKDYW